MKNLIIEIISSISIPLLRRIYIYILSIPLILFISCSRAKNISDVILNDKQSFYYIDVNEYPADRSSLPIGIFDSGTGGLAVLNDILEFKGSNYLAAKDTGIVNIHEFFTHESFIFLADLANMPYGSYSMEKNTGLLVEHVLKDVQFLLGNKYYQTAQSPEYKEDKSPVKVIVIACNTATAYGLDTIRDFLKRANLNIGIIGVIDAGAQGALENFSPDEKGSVAILATDGTVKSGAYPKTLKTMCNELDQYANIQVFQQAGIGIAEAIDENIDFIDKNASEPREQYKGPSEKENGEMKIDLSLWNRYNFNMDSGAMLFEGEKEHPHNLQINSVENYISFHLVSLMEKIKNTDGAQPLRSVVLACTHYPYFEKTFRETLYRLRDYKEGGVYIYRPLMAENILIINPGDKIAIQLYQFLTERDLQSKTKVDKSEFFITVPNVLNNKVKLRGDGSFTYEYKYGRKIGDIQEYVKCIPISRSSVQKDILTRLSSQVPKVFELLVIFNHENPKTGFLRDEEKINKE